MINRKWSTSIWRGGALAAGISLCCGATLRAQNTFPSTGNVGIGTTAPQAQLHLSGGSIYGTRLFLSNSNDTAGQDFSINVGGTQNGGGNPSNILGFWTTNTDGTLSGNVMTLTGARTVGIGTASPSAGAKLEVNGNVTLTAGSGASVTYADGTVQSTAWTGILPGGDYAEAMSVVGRQDQYQAGDVLVLGSGESEDVQRCSKPYSTMVAGIYATKPGVIGRRRALSERKNEIPMAMVGVVPTKVSAENGPIHKGDLLVTSSTPGFAMKGTDRSRMLGAVVGKALQPLKSGKGVIDVLVTLQ